MLSRRLLLGLPSRLPKNRRILTQNTSKADSSTNLCPPERGKGPVLARAEGFPEGKYVFFGENGANFTNF